MNCEIHRADWTIPYPNRCDAESVPRALHPLTHVEHEWDGFPWHLAGSLVSLLESPEASFEYLHITGFFRARAAMLALRGCVLDHGDLYGALSAHRVQAGGIYREHLLFHIRQYLDRQNLTRMPDCHGEECDPTGDAECHERNRAILRKVVRVSEMSYLQTLNFISVATSMDEEVAKHSVGFWVRGAQMPDGVDVAVRVRRVHDTHEVRPSPEDVKRLIRDGRPLWKIVVKAQGELGFVANEERGMLNAEVNTGERGMSEEGGGRWTAGSGSASADGDVGLRRDDRAVRGRRTEVGTDENKGPGWKVVGDYAVIIPPGGRREINLSTRHKVRAVLRFIHTRLMEAGTREFLVEEMREAFNAQFSGSLASKQWRSDRIREDLFKGKEREFDLLFETLDKAAARYRIKLCGWLAALGMGAWGDGGIGELAQWAVGEVGMWA